MYKRREFPTTLFFVISFLIGIQNAFAGPSSSIATDTMTFDLTNARIVNEGADIFYDLPVFFQSETKISSFDFWFRFTTSKLTYHSTITMIPQLDSYSFFNTNNQYLSNTTSGPSTAFEIPANTLLVYVRFKVSNTCVSVGKSDFQMANALLNGEVCVPYFKSEDNRSIEISESSICTDVGVKFFVPSPYFNQPITSWNWDLGNGVTSTNQQTSTSYSNADSIIVTCTITTVAGCTYELKQRLLVNPTPIVSFTAFYDPSKDSVFTVNNSDALTYQWYFSDGQIDTRFEPVHYFDNGGDSEIRLFGRSDKGCYNSSVFTVNIPKPESKFTAPNGCVGTEIVFNNTSPSFAFYDWDFGDGFLSSDFNPKHTYSSPGEYIVKLKTTVGNKNGVYFDTLRIGITPIVQFGADRIEGCIPVDVQFTNTTLTDSGSVYSWSFGNVGTSALKNPSYRFIESGSVSLIVTTPYGCVDSLKRTNFIKANPQPFVGFNFSAACLNDAISFTNQSTISSGNIQNYAWDFGIGGTATTKDPIVTFVQEGTMAVKLSVTSNKGCTQTTTRTVEVHKKPVVDWSVSQEEGCVPLNVVFLGTDPNNSNGTFHWTFGDNSSSSLIQPNHSYTTKGDFTVQLKVTLPGGCSDSLLKEDIIKVNDGVLTDFDVTNQCAEKTSQFKDQSTVLNGTINEWNWQFGDGFGSNSPEPTYSYQFPGFYTVKLQVKTTTGCSATREQIIQVDALPYLDIRYSANKVCDFQAIEFEQVATNNPTVTYQWSSTDGGVGTTKMWSHNFDSSGVYGIQCIGVSPKGCSDTLLIQLPISIVQKPVASFVLNDTIAVVDFTSIHPTNTSINASSYRWSSEDGWYSEEFEPQYVFSSSGIKKWCLVAKQTEECADTTCKDIRVEANFPVVLPQAFSPNGDGINDVLTPIGGPLTQFQMKVYNHFGNLLFETTDMKLGWDGTFNAEPQIEGTYEVYYEGISATGANIQDRTTIILTR